MVIFTLVASAENNWNKLKEATWFSYYRQIDKWSVSADFRLWQEVTYATNFLCDMTHRKVVADGHNEVKQNQGGKYSVSRIKHNRVKVLLFRGKLCVC